MAGVHKAPDPAYTRFAASTSVPVTHTDPSPVLERACVDAGPSGEMFEHDSDVDAEASPVKAPHQSKEPNSRLEQRVPHGGSQGTKSLMRADPDSEARLKQASVLRASS